MPLLIVERSFGTRLEEAELSHMFARLGPCLEQHRARWVHSYLSEDRTRMFCVFEAADAETVRTAHRVVGVSFDRVWAAERLESED